MKLARRTVTVLLISAVLPLTAVAAFAGPFTATYTFTGSPGNQASEPVDSQPTGATLSDITRGPGLLTSFTGANSINSNGWTISGAIDAGDYYALTITPAAGFQMDLTDLDFTERRSGTGILTFEVRSSLDTFGSAIVTRSVPDNEANRRQEIDLGAAFLDLMVPVEFRIFGYSSETAVAGTWRLGIANGEAGATTFPANLQLVGDLTAIPQPSTLVLLGASLIGVVSAAWLRRRS